MKIEELIKENKGTIIDVRTPEEFQGGHVVGSINIPLQEVSGRLEEIKNHKTPIILCCASGGRSGVATQILQQSGVESYNAGSWLDVNYIQSQN
ncbi:MAG TPA: rhodanese-like domain-containing protein [Chitinophagaceae bacterium]|nr:MAG: rhodanese-like protein [Bacteroidetes bacterium OLB11]HMN33355.1 rhodanese-like domain-containing protein [Chitinophagaceae bacterium]